MKVASAPLLLMDCHPCEGNPAFSSPPHMPPRARRHFFVLGGGPNGDYTAFFSLCQEPDTLSRVGMASGRYRFLPQTPNGNRTGQREDEASVDYALNGGLCSRRLFGLHPTKLGHHYTDVVCRFDVKVFNGLGPRRGFVVWRNDAAKRPCRFARY